MEPTDAVLFEQWTRARNADAFAELMARHTNMVYATALRIVRNSADAEEVTQECFLKLSQQRRAAHTSLAGWLHRIAANRSIDVIRRRRAASDRHTAVATPDFTSTDPAWAEVEAILDEEIAALPGDLRLPIVLHFFEGKTHAAVAAELNTSRPTVTRRIHDATDALRDRLIKRGIALTAAVLATTLASLEATAAPAALTTRLGKRLLASDVAPKAVAGSGAWGMGVWASVAILIAVGTAGALIGLRGDTPAAPSGTPSTSAITQPIDSAPPHSDSVGVVLTNAPAQAAMVATDAEEAKPYLLRCIDEDGTPIAGAEVYYVSLQRDASLSPPLLSPGQVRKNESGPLISDSDGYVTIPEFEVTKGYNGPYRSAYARVPGKLAGCWEDTSRSPFPEEPQVITLLPSVAVSGTVAVPDGHLPQEVTVSLLTVTQPVAGNMRGAMVGFASDHMGPALGSLTSFPDLAYYNPSPTGAYVIPDMPQGATVYLTANAPGLAEAQLMATELAALSHADITMAQLKGSEAAALSNADITMVSEGRIEGTIRKAATHRPVSATDYAVFARVTAAKNVKVTHSHFGEIRPNGTYSIGGLAEGEYAVVLTPLRDDAELIAPVLDQRRVEPGTVLTDNDFLLEEGVLLSGRVEAADTKAGIPDVGIGLLSPGEMNGQMVAMAVTDDEGRYTLRVPSGTSMLYVCKGPEEGYAYPKDQGRQTFDVNGGEGTIEAEAIRLNPLAADDPMQMSKYTAIIRGRVVDEDGHGVADVSITDDWEYMQGDDRRLVSPSLGKTNAEGYYEGKLNTGGIHKVQAYKEGYTVEWSEAFHLRADEAKPVPDIALIATEH